MVFGWGKKKSEREMIGSAGLENQVSLSQINEILKKNETQRLGRLLETARSIRTKVETERQNIIQITSQLEEDNLKVDDVDKHLKMLLERGKASVISGLRKETSIKLSSTEKYSDIINLNSAIGQMLKRIGDILGANSRIMHVFARKYADKLKENLATVATNKSELQSLVDEQTKFESNTRSILDWCERIKNSKKEIDEKNQKLAEIKDKIENCTKTVQVLEYDINNLKSKSEYQEFLNVKKEIELLSPAEGKVMHEIDMQFLKISRPLGKYSYISSLEKPLKKIMRDMIATPSEVLVLENKSAIVEVLQAVVRGVVAGNVSVKDSDKAIEQIEETINRLDEFLKMKDSLSQKRTTLENRFSVFNIKDLEERERMLSKTRDDKAQLESNVKSLENEVSEARKHIPQLARDIETKLKEISGTRMTLKI